MNQKTIQTIRDCGAAEMPVPESCVLAGVTIDQFVRSTELIDAYRTGQLESKFLIHQAVVRMAKEGQPQMVKLYEELIAQPILPTLNPLPAACIEHEEQEVLVDDQPDS